MLQWIPPDMLLLRLMGAKIVAQTQIETTGTNLLDVLYPPQREATKLYTQAHDDHLAVIYLKTERQFASGKDIAAKFVFPHFLAMMAHENFRSARIKPIKRQTN